MVGKRLASLFARFVLSAILVISFTPVWAYADVLTDGSNQEAEAQNVGEGSAGNEDAAKANGEVAVQEDTSTTTPTTTAVAKIGDTTYATLKEAIASVTDSTETTITLLADVTNGDGIEIPSGRNITIDLGGHSYKVTQNLVGSTGTQTNAFRFFKDSNVVIKNGKLWSTSSSAHIIIQNYANLTLDSVAVSGAKYLAYTKYLLSCNHGKTILKGATKLVPQTSSQYAINVCYGMTGYEGDMSLLIESSDVTLSGRFELEVTGSATAEDFVQHVSVKAAKGWTLPKISYADKKKLYGLGFYANEDGSYSLGKAEAYSVTTKTYYATFAEALEASGSKASVRLCSDIALSNNIFVNDGKTLTLDLDGFNIMLRDGKSFRVENGKLELTGTYGSIIEESPNFAPIVVKGSAEDVANYSVVKVSTSAIVLQGWSGIFVTANNGCAYGVDINLNGKINCVRDTAGYSGTGIYVNGSINKTEGNVPKIILGKNARIAPAEGVGSSGLYLAGYANTTIAKGAEITAGDDNCGIEIRAGKLTVNGGIITGGLGQVNAVANGNGSSVGNAGIAVSQHTSKLPVEVTINDGAIMGGAAFYECNPQGNGTESTAKIKLAINGGTFTAKTNKALYSEDCTGFVAGGTFSTAVSEEACAAGFTPKVNDDGTYGVQGVVQILNAKGAVVKDYGTLADAVAATTKGQTVKLLADITEDVVVPEGTNITLDLNGKTLKAATKGKATVLNNGTLTITDSSEDGTGVITRDDTADSAYYVIDNQGTMTIKSGTITNTSYRGAGKGASAVRNAGNDKAATLTIEGGTIAQDAFIAVKNDDHGILYVKGGTIKALNSPVGNDYAAVQNWAQATITGGDLTGSVWTCTWSDELDPSKTVISDSASVKGNIKVLIYDNMTTVAPTLEIKGGTFDIGSWEVSGEGAVAAVSGGTFTKAVPESVCATGYIPITNEDGTYSVKAGKYLASVGDTKYETVADAIAAAKDGDIVKLLDDVDLSSPIIVEGKQVILDANGKTVFNTTDIWNVEPNGWSLVSVRENGNLTITGNGNFVAKENDCYAIDVQDPTAKLTIENGTINGNISAVYAEEVLSQSMVAHSKSSSLILSQVLNMYICSIAMMLITKMAQLVL